ncbi:MULTISPECIES: NERD domain-containing protein [unclassified Microcoleus]|uniref:NERD domain-containing protein n=1 Tax=unclassified Microcoleus TaxID=2642155 RepID=UPI002FD682C7
MTVQVYRTHAYGTTHENRIFDALANELKRVWADSDDLIILLGNFYCDGSEIDAAVMKRNSITVIEFKDYGGNITFSENGLWLAGEVQVRGGSKPNPFIQVRDNKFALLNSLKRISFSSDRQPNLGYISGLVLFHKPITFDEEQLPPNIERWFHVVDFAGTIQRLSQITSREINLSYQDLAKIVQHFSIPDYVPPGWGNKAITDSLSAVDTAKFELPNSLESVVSRIEQFLGSSKKILIITGMMGTGLHLLQKAIADKSRSLRRNCSVLAPNSKIASLYSVESKSIYSHIFTKNYKVEKDLLIYGLNKNQDTEQQVYIVGDAHLISNSPFENDVFRYGSGQLLTDFLEYTEIEKTKRQVIFMGDMFQLTRGKIDESALSYERLQAAIGGEIEQINLDFILPGQEQNLFVRNCQQIAQSIHCARFNQLATIADDSNCIQIVDRDREQEVSKAVFQEDCRFTKFIVFTNESVNRINNQVRQEYLGLGKDIVAGDIVHIHNSPVALDRQQQEPTYISNNSFAEVLEVYPNTSPLSQPLKGREQPIKVIFMRLRVRLIENGKEVEFYCLRDYLYAEKPELDKDTLIALQVSAISRFRQQQKQVIESEGSDKSNELAKFLRSDPHLNAARLRFGYALTLHRAQGQQFKTAIANMDTGQGQTNAAYFRWVYTLFFVTKNKLFLLNFPSITPFLKTTWNDSKCQLNSVVFKDLIAFDPDSAAGNTNISGFPIPEKSLKNLYLYLVEILRFHRIQVNSYKHNSYQEVYEFGSEDGKASCSLRLHYNGKFQVTRIEKVKSDPIEFADLVRDFITSKLRSGNEFQQTIRDIIKAKLDSHKIAIWGIEHHDYHQFYYLKSDVGNVKMQIFYDGDGFVTQVFPIAYTNLKIAELVRLALEL